jgi:hypothetical protein
MEKLLVAPLVQTTLSAIKKIFALLTLVKKLKAMRVYL